MSLDKATPVMNYPALSEGGASMDGMTAPAHAKPARADLLWVLVLIAACGLLEVWASWLQIGSVSGFPKLGAMTTGWILPVTTEAYWTAALYAWLVAPAGPRSKRFAMWSAAAVFGLSLAGQESDHLLAAAHRTVPPVGVVGFVTALPLIAVALIAVLIEVRHLDQADAEKTERSEREAAQHAAAEASEADERTALRAQVDALTAELETRHGALMSELEAERIAHASAQRDLAEALTRAEKLAAKLAARNAQQARTKKQEIAHDEDITTEFKALDELQKDPSLRAPRMGAELGRRIGVSPATGRRLHAKLTAQERDGESLGERSADQSDERSGERS